MKKVFYKRVLNIICRAMCIHSYCMKTKWNFLWRWTKFIRSIPKIRKLFPKFCILCHCQKNLNCLKTSKAHNYETGLARLVWSHESEQKLKQKSIKMWKSGQIRVFLTGHNLSKINCRKCSDPRFESRHFAES